MKNLVILTIAVFSTATALVASSAYKVWEQIYENRPGDLSCSDMLHLAGGDFVLAGGTDYHADAYMIRADPDGNVVWARGYYSPHSYGAVHSVQETHGDGLVFAGWWGYSGNFDFWLLRTDSGGDTLWTKDYGLDAIDEKCNSIVQTADSGFALAGYTLAGAGVRDFWIVKTNADGDSLWSRTYGGDQADECHAILQTVDSGYALAGDTRSFGAGQSDFWLVKIAANGDSLWSRSFGGASYEYCQVAIQTADSGFLLVGRTSSFGAGSDDFWLVKVGADGDSLWSRSFGGDQSDRCYDIEPALDGGYVLAGETRSLGSGSAYDSWLVRIDADGDSLWSEAFGLGTESQHAECRGVHQVSDSCYVLGGRLSAAFDAMTLMKVSLCPDLAPVSDLVIQVAGDDALLSWTNVICADAYLVYFAEVSDGPYWYLGFTTDSTYVHPTVAYFASDMFYEVESYIGSLPELTASTFGIEPGSMRKADLLNLLHR